MGIMKIIVGTLGGVVIGMSTLLHAISYTDTNPADTYLSVVLNPSYTGSWDLVNEGYDPITEQIDSAIATFTLVDTVGSERWTVTVDTQSFASGGNIPNATLAGLGTFTFANNVQGSALVTLDQTGLLSYTVTSTYGNFWLTEASLTAQASERLGYAIPDGGASIAILGLGILSLLGLKRGLA